MRGRTFVRPFNIRKHMSAILSFPHVVGGNPFFNLENGWIPAQKHTGKGKRHNLLLALPTFT